MRLAAASILLVFVFAGCADGDLDDQPSAAAPSETPSPSRSPSPSPSLSPSPVAPDPSIALRADCASAQPVLTAVNEAAAKAGASVITTADAAAVFQSRQTELEALAASSPNAAFAGVGQAVADSVGRVRVALLQGGDVGGAVSGYLDEVRVLVAVCQGGA